jgi:hypothetical protein
VVQSTGTPYLLWLCADPCIFSVETKTRSPQLDSAVFIQFHHGRLNSPPIRASAARRICGLPFSFSFLFFSLFHYICISSILCKPARAKFLFFVSHRTTKTCSPPVQHTLALLSSTLSFSRSGITSSFRLQKFNLRFSLQTSLTLHR